MRRGILISGIALLTTLAAQMLPGSPVSLFSVAHAASPQACIPVPPFTCTVDPIVRPTSGPIVLPTIPPIRIAPALPPKPIKKQDRCAAERANLARAEGEARRTASELSSANSAEQSARGVWNVAAEATATANGTKAAGWLQMQIKKQM
ncbi:MAG: hypothetical protein M3Q44_03200 [bacterium]|nr:hypothetical protein [bacterium]